MTSQRKDELDSYYVANPVTKKGRAHLKLVVQIRPANHIAIIIPNAEAKLSMHLKKQPLPLNQEKKSAAGCTDGRHYLLKYQFGTVGRWGAAVNF